MAEIDEIKQKIAYAANELFMKYGIRSISMDDIARHLGMSKKTIYQHFSDKEDIIILATQAHLNKNWQEFEGIRQSSTNAIDELAKISVFLKKNMEELNPSLLFDLKKYHPKAWNNWQDFKLKCILESVQRNLKQGIEEGYYRPELNVEIISIVRMALIEIAFDDRIFSQEKFKITEVQLQIFDHFVCGIVTEKGKKLYQQYREANHENLLTPITI